MTKKILWLSPSALLVGAFNLAARPSGWIVTGSSGLESLQMELISSQASTSKFLLSGLHRTNGRIWN